LIEFIQEMHRVTSLLRMLILYFTLINNVLL